MCRTPKPQTPTVVRRDPEAEAAQAMALGAQEANKQTAFRRRRQRKSTLLSMGAAGYTGPSAPALLASATPGGG